MKLTDMTVSAQASALSSRDISSEELTRAYLAEIDTRDAAIGAYLTVTADAAIEQARAIDAARVRGEEPGTLAGIPIGIKDNICTRGVRTTCASRMLENFVPPYDATVMTKLHEAGLVMLGKLNMDEFAMGSTTENSAFQITRNPVCPDRVPGGSSGGSAAAVAAGLAPIALGSDTGGSIRQPAAFCGVVGMKPTYGTVSRYGLIAFASSLDQIGPLGRSVEDISLLLPVIMGHDPLDSTSVKDGYAGSPTGYTAGLRGRRIGLPREYFGEGLQPVVRDAVMQTAKVCESLGAEIVELSLPSLIHALPAYYVISSAEASSNLSRFDGVKYGFRAADASDPESLIINSRSEGFGQEVQRRILLGTFALSAGYYDAYYKKAQQVRTLIRQEFDRAFESCDLILSPVAPTTAYKLGEKSENPLEMYMGDVYTVPVNIAGLPALSLPVGADADGLPIGAQLIGPAFSEGVILSAAAHLERALKGAM